MDPGPYLIDTNVFVIDLRYPRDRNFGVNRRFLDAIKRERCGVTTTINLLELCGILSFNLNQRQLITLWEQFPNRFGVDVLPAADLEAPVPKMSVAELFALLQRRMSLGDAQSCWPPASTRHSRRHWLPGTATASSRPIRGPGGDPRSDTRIAAASPSQPRD